MRIKFALFIVIFLIITLFIYPVDFTEVDELYRYGKYQEGLNKTLTLLDKSNPDAHVIWRIGRFYYEIAYTYQMTGNDKNKKINKYDNALDFLQSYISLKNGTPRDRAQIVFWYAASMGSRGEIIGIKESLDTVPELFKLADKAISIDPTLGAPYFLKGRIDSAVPGFLGGDKFRMGINLSTALKYDSKELSVLVDCADAFIKRNWDVNKKRSMKDKKGITDGTPQNMTDKEHAEKLLNDAIVIYKSMSKPSKRDTDKYNEAIQLLKKIK